MSEIEHISSKNQAYTPLFWIVFAFILGVGGFLRFNHLTGQGILSYDEAWYQLTAQTYFQLPEFLRAVMDGTPPKEAFNTIYHWGFYPQLGFKPTYLTLLMLTKGVVGLHNPASGAILSAVLGLGIILTIYKITEKLSGNIWVGLVSAAIASTSGFLVRYSRYGLPHCLSALAILVCLLAFFKRLDIKYLTLKAQYGLGILTGLLVTTNDTVLPAMLLFIGIETLTLLYFSDILKTNLNNMLKKLPWKHWFIYIFGVMTPILFWEIVIIVIRKIYHRTLHKGYTVPYIKQVLSHVTHHKVGTTHGTGAPIDYGFFFRLFEQTEMLYFSIWLILGFIITGRSFWKNRCPKLLVLFIFSSIFFTLITIYPDKVARLAMPFMPLFIITASLGIGWSLKSFKSSIQKSFISIILLMLLFPATQYGYSLSKITTGFHQAGQEITKSLQANEPIAVPVMYPIYALYTQHKVHKFRNKDHLKKILAENPGIKTFVFNIPKWDWFCQKYPDQCFASPNNKTMDEIENWLIENAVSREHVMNNHIYDYPIYWEEHYEPSLYPLLRKHREHTYSDTIRIYTLPENYQTLFES